MNRKCVLCSAAAENVCWFHTENFKVRLRRSLDEELCHVSAGLIPDLSDHLLVEKAQGFATARFTFVQHSTDLGEHAHRLQGRLDVKPDLKKERSKNPLIPKLYLVPKFVRYLY